MIFIFHSILGKELNRNIKADLGTGLVTTEEWFYNMSYLNNIIFCGFEFCGVKQETFLYELVLKCVAVSHGFAP